MLLSRFERSRILDIAVRRAAICRRLDDLCFLPRHDPHVSVLEQTILMLDIEGTRVVSDAVARTSPRRLVALSC